MKAIKVVTFGEPDVLSLVEIESPVLGANEVLVDVEAAGVGTVDVLFRRGLFPGLNEPGFIPGMEIAGIVNKVGANVSEKWKGRRVYALSTLGGYAEQVVVSESALVPVPDSLSSIQAVSIGINSLVANFSLQRARLSAGDRILVRGAGGGIGSMAVQLALASQYDTSVTDTTAYKRKELENIGVRNFVALTEPNVNDKNFNAIVDPVGGPDLEKYVALLAENGVYVLNGAAGGFPDNDFGMSWLGRFQRSLTLACFSLNSIPAADIKSSLSQLFQLAIDGKIVPFVSEVLPLEDAGEAHRILETGSVFGKIVLTI